VRKSHDGTESPTRIDSIGLSPIIIPAGRHSSTITPSNSFFTSLSIPEYVVAAMLAGSGLLSWLRQD